MGNSPSELINREPEDIWWQNGENQETGKSSAEDITHDSNIPVNSIENFDRKREKRKQILEAKRQEIQGIRKELHMLRQENEILRKGSKNSSATTDERVELLEEENDKLISEITELKVKERQTEYLLEKNKELRTSVSEMQSELQNLNSCVLDFEQQKEDYKRHVMALKDVIKVSKELILIRENELKELKEKMNSIERAFKDKEASLMSTDLRREYEKQLASIRTLRELYEERSRTHRRETILLKSSLADKDKEIENISQKNSELTERIDELEKENSNKYDTIKSLESNLGLAKAESRQYQAELTVINQLFSHILLAFNNSPELDLDKLLKQLEENHDLLKDIVSNEISSEVSAALPKVLLNLVNQIAETSVATSNHEDCSDEKLSPITDHKDVSTAILHNLNSPAEIAENLPKVWRVLIELLSHQSGNIPDIVSSEEDSNRCFKTVATPKGPDLVLSVSKTFFRLKELIVEKKTLEKDMNNLKQLNSHLESRLQEQEKRFNFVSSELSKTWNFVSKLQKEHHLLHTQEKILRYELAQKRKLLNQLKEELEYSRDKWQQAREKNSKTEKEWLVLRKEFAARKKTLKNEDGNNSVESGYSDERDEMSDEEPGYETDISECNIKGEDAVEEDVAVSEDTQAEDLSISKEAMKINEILSENLSLPSSSVDETPTSSHESLSILNVIQNEITNISENLPSDKILTSTESTTECTSEVGEKCQIKNSEDIQLFKNEISIQNVEPSTSNTSTTSFEERLALRDERLRRLEGQCKDLVSQVTNTSHKSVAIYNKLEDLHELYGESSRNAQEDTNTPMNEVQNVETNSENSNDVEESES